jgi:hypothetical protein
MLMQQRPPETSGAQPHAPDLTQIEPAATEPRPAPIPAKPARRQDQVVENRKAASLRTHPKPPSPARGTKLRAEGLQLELPDKWESRQLSSGVALRPTGLPAGSRFALVVLPNTNVEGPFDDWFQSRWRELTSSYSMEGTPRVQRGKTRSGLAAAQMSAEVHDPGGAVSYVLFWAAQSRGRVAMMVGRGSGPHLAKSLDAPIRQILESADVEP